MIDRAISGGPQTVTRSGQKAVVVVSADEWERKTHRAGNLADFFASSRCVALASKPSAARMACANRAVSFLLDTNLVSEWTRPRPNRGVIEWLAQVDEDRVFISVLTLAELRHGVDRLAAGKRRSQLDEWLRVALPLRFDSRVLSIDAAVADACGAVVAQREGIGRPIQAMDALMAATAKVHQLSVVTRNVDDFKPSVAAINPWL